MRYFFFILIALNSFSDTQFTKSRMYHSYKEGKFHYLDVYKVKPNSLQEKIHSYQFTSLFQLEEYQKNNLDSELRQSFKFSQFNFSNTENENNYIWKSENQWNADWEEKYSRWVNENLTEDFFNKYNIQTDCADVAFALRWIFSRIHSLPAANTLAGSGAIFSNYSFKNSWSSLKRHTQWHKDELFLKALDYLLDNTYTRTLHRDTYPIKLERKSFLNGTIRLLGNHTEIISKINFNNGKIPAYLYSSTIPRRLRELMKTIFLPASNPNIKTGGLVKFRWPSEKFKLKPKKEMPFYSEEQYSEEMNNGDLFALELFKKLNITLDPNEIIKEFIADLHNILNTRVEIVEEGFNYCQSKDCSLGSINYENHSTPSRDKRFKNKLKTYEAIIDSFEYALPGIRDTYAKKLTETKISINDKELSLQSISSKMNNFWLSFNPNDSIEARWAIDEEEIKKSLLQNIERFNKFRFSKVDKAKKCRERQCKIGSKSWNSMNTFKEDNFIKEFIYGSYKMCFQGKRFLNCLNENVIPYQNLLFLSSNPNHPLKTRQGKHFFDYQINFFPPAKELDEVLPKVYWSKSDGKLYNFASDIIIDGDYEKVFKLNKNYFVTLNNSELLFLDNQFNEVSSVLEDVDEITRIKENIFFISFYDETQNGIYKFSNEDFSLILQTSEFIYNTSNARFTVLKNNNSFKVINNKTMSEENFSYLSDSVHYEISLDEKSNFLIDNYEKKTRIINLNNNETVIVNKYLQFVHENDGFLFLSDSSYQKCDINIFDHSLNQFDSIKINHEWCEYNTSNDDLYLFDKNGSRYFLIPNHEKNFKEFKLQNGISTGFTSPYLKENNLVYFSNSYIYVKKINHNYIFDFPFSDISYLNPLTELSNEESIITTYSESDESRDEFQVDILRLDFSKKNHDFLFHAKNHDSYWYNDSHLKTFEEDEITLISTLNDMFITID